MSTSNRDSEPTALPDPKITDQDIVQAGPEDMEPWRRRIDEIDRTVLELLNERAVCANRIGAIKKADEVVGNETRVKVVKNKVAPPFKQADFDIMFNVGIDHYGILVDMGVEADIVQKSGAWFSYGDVRLGQGRENAKAFLQENLPLAQEIEGRVKEMAGLRNGSGPAEESAEAADD